MATIIDALLVTLALDPKDFKKGAKEVQDTLDKTGKSAKKPSDALEAAGKKGAEAMGKFRNELLRTAAAFIGLKAIQSFVSSVTQSDAALGRMSNNVGMSTEALSAWEGVARRAGGTADGMAGDIKGLVQQVSRFSLTGEGGEAFKYFRAIGVAVTDASGKIRPMSDVLLEVADKFQGMDPAKAQALGAGMGFSEGTINVLMQGRAALRAMLDEQAKANVRTPEDTKNAIARQNAWRLLTDTFNRLATNILNVVTPALVGLMDFIRNNAGTSATLLGAVAVAMTSMSLTRFAGVISSLGQLSTAFAGAAGNSGALMAIMGRLGLLGAVGLGSYGLAKLALEKTGITDALGDLGAYEGTHDAISMAGGYVPGTVKGLGNMGKKGASSGAGGGSPEQAAYLKSLEKQFGLPAGLLDSIWVQESSRGKNKGSSTAGAMGDFQQMPATAKAYGIVDRMDFGQSAMGAARMFSDLLKQYKGNLPMAIAAYNEGSGNLAKRGMGNLPMETAKYIPSVMNRMGGGAQGGNTNSTTVSVGKLEVHTAATDAQGIARELPAAIQNQQYALQANTGLQ